MRSSGCATSATGQVFEPEAVRLACEYTCGQPYLVNAFARWCVEKIHHDDGVDMQGLLLAFRDFWRENAQMNRAPFEYNEAYPHIVLQAQ